MSRQADNNPKKPKYIPNRRFLVNFNVDGKTRFSRRFRNRATAIKEVDRCQIHKGIKPKVFDSKKGVYLWLGDHVSFVPGKGKCKNHQLKSSNQ